MLSHEAVQTLQVAAGRFLCPPQNDLAFAHRDLGNSLSTGQPVLAEYPLGLGRVVVTTFTDCSGFLSFLGLATLFLRFLRPS